MHVCLQPKKNSREYVWNLIASLQNLYIYM